MRDIYTEAHQWSYKVVSKIARFAQKIDNSWNAGVTMVRALLYSILRLPDLNENRKCFKIFHKTLQNPIS